METKITVKIINLSSKVFNQHHISLLQRGLKFVPTPKGPDLMTLEKDIKEYVRLLKLKEYFHYRTYTDDDSLLKPHSDFTPMQTRHPVLQSVCDTLTSTAENLQNLVPDNNYSNLSYDERTALQDLKQDDTIVIKEADKGSVVVILDKAFYRNQMLSTLSNTSIYKCHKSNIDNSISLKIKKFASKYYTSGMLTLKERKYITNFNFTTANFYGNPKIHKSETIKAAVNSMNGPYIHIETDDITFRGITGCPNSPTSKLSELLNVLLKPFISKIKSHVKDTTDFLNKLNRFSRDELQDIILITVDVVSMYPSIKKDLGLKALRHFCDKYPELLHDRFTVDFIIEGMIIILDDNLCQFDDKFYTQISGTCTGTTVAPTYATLTMAYLEFLLMDKLINIYSPNVVDYISNNWLRYLDDGFIAWNKNFGDVDLFINALNSLDDNINFTYEIHEQQVSYLNVLVYKGDHSLLCDIFYKETDTREYLPFSSCHVHHCKINIPYNLCRTICTIVEDPDIMYNRLYELRTHLLKSKYPINIINSAINKAAAMDQIDLRTPRDKDNSEVLVFVSDYNPKNPTVSHILHNCMSLLKANPLLKEIFGDIKFINSKREPPSLYTQLTHSKFVTTKPVFGTFKCHTKQCKTCPAMYETNKYYFWRADYVWNIREHFDCSTKDCIYVLTCQGCANYYIGKTVNLRNRMTKHRADIIDDNLRLAYVHRHIERCGRGKFFVTPFYKVKTKGLVAHLSIESYFIRKFKPALNTLGT